MLSLIIPVTAGLGLNFAIVLGAMVGQVGLIVATSLQDFPDCWGCQKGNPLASNRGAPGDVWRATCLDVQARGRGVASPSMMLGFSANGLYQLEVIPVHTGDGNPLEQP